MVDGSNTYDVGQKCGVYIGSPCCTAAASVKWWRLRSPIEELLEGRLAGKCSNHEGSLTRCTGKCPACRGGVAMMLAAARLCCTPGMADDFIKSTLRIVATPSSSATHNSRASLYSLSSKHCFRGVAMENAHETCGVRRELPGTRTQPSRESQSAAGSNLSHWNSCR